MNPSNNSGMELPQPVNIESEPAPKLPGADSSPGPEQSRSRESLPLSNAGAQMPTSIPLNIVPGQQTPPAQDATDDSSKIPSKSLIIDKDLIEKEWVDKAKAIVEKTKEDPFQQSKEITLLKADYMKKEFNKIIKLDD